MAATTHEGDVFEVGMGCGLALPFEGAANDENVAPTNARSGKTLLPRWNPKKYFSKAKFTKSRGRGRGAESPGLPELPDLSLSMPSLSDDDDSCACGEGDNDNGSYDDNGEASWSESCSGSRRSAAQPSEARSLEDALALEVGLNAHEYLEECFYAEVSVLDRAKFNAVPEVVKSDFSIKGHLGKGSFSDVFDVVCKTGRLPSPGGGGGRMRKGRSTSVTLGALSRRGGDRNRPAFAMKCLRPQIRSDAEQFTIGSEDLVHETALLANLDHRHIIKIHGRAAGHLTDAFLLNDGYFILLDKLSETLQDRTETWRQTLKIGQGPSLEQLEVAHSIADAMAYLHSKNIAFRDLKPENVGFDCNGVMKLFDLGFAAILPERDESNPAGFLFDRCGTPRYMAPEVGLSLGYGLSSDVYSFAILLWEMGTLAKPFAYITSSEEFDREVFVGGHRPEIGDQWSASIKELIDSCWSAVPTDRPTMLDVKSSLSMAIFNNSHGKEAPTKTVRRSDST